MARTRLNALARSWEGEPRGEPWRNPARTEPRPPGITQSRLARRVMRGFAVLGLMGVLGITLLVSLLWLDHHRETTLPTPNGLLLISSNG